MRSFSRATASSGTTAINGWGGQIVDQLLRVEGIEVQEWLELDALDALAALVDLGLGIAIVPDWAPLWPERLILGKRQLPAGLLCRTGVLSSRKSARKSALEALVQVIGNRIKRGDALTALRSHQFIPVRRKTANPPWRKPRT